MTIKEIKGSDLYQFTEIKDNQTGLDEKAPAS